MLKAFLAIALLTIPASGALTLEEKADTAILSNEIVSATIHKGNASIQSLKFKDTEFIRQQRGGAYYSMDGGKNFRVISDCSFRIEQQSAEIIEVVMAQKWSAQPQAVDIEIHYILRPAVSGLYTYAIVRHPASYPATKLGEWRMVWKLPPDLLDTICVDRLRFRKMPTAAEFALAKPTDITEIVQLTTGPWAGKFDCKYDYNADYHSTPFWGHADSRSGLGAWMVFGAHEWFNDGPTKQDLTAADRIIHVHFGMNHYHTEPTSIAAGEAWSKTYGPFLLYMNQLPGGPTANVQDANRKAREESASWPYPWMKPSSDYPSAKLRGSATGTFLIKDAAKPNLTSANAWIGLSQPPPGGNWQFESKNYQYWTRVNPDGSFSIPHVRPGTYTLSAFADGAFGEFEKKNVEIKPATSTELGSLTWTIPRDRGQLIWEIGIPNRRADEFHSGDAYFQGYLWKSFYKTFPNPLDYHVGTSTPAKDWNYAHSAYLTPNNPPQPWKWRIHFDLPRKPSADATLTIGIASADRASLDLSLNDQTKPFFTLIPQVQGGNALLREGIHAKYSYTRIPIPAKLLREGKNTLTLVQSRTHSPSFHIMYDALSLEVP